MVFAASRSSLRCASSTLVQRNVTTTTRPIDRYNFHTCSSDTRLRSHQSRCSGSCHVRCTNQFSTGRTDNSIALGQTYRLPDGRDIGFNEYGDPNGTPIVYIHGSPDSGIVLGPVEDRVAKEHNVRWIAPDRPGIGLSTFQPNRSVLDYPADLQCLLIDHLKLDHFRILSVSGGTGYALACAKSIPKERLRAVGVCVGVGPWEAGLQGQSVKNRVAMHLWKRWPRLMALSMERAYVPLARDPDPTKMEELFKKAFNTSMFTEREKNVLLEQDAIEAVARAFRQVFIQGVAGITEEMRLVTQPWGFNLEDVNYEGIRLWYGSLDKNTPPKMGRHMARRLPKARYKEYEGESHFTLWNGTRLAEWLPELLKGKR